MPGRGAGAGGILPPRLLDQGLESAGLIPCGGEEADDLRLVRLHISGGMFQDDDYRFVRNVPSGFRVGKRSFHHAGDGPRALSPTRNSFVS